LQAAGFAAARQQELWRRARGAQDVRRLAAQEQPGVSRRPVSVLSFLPQAQQRADARLQVLQGQPQGQVSQQQERRALLPPALASQLSRRHPSQFFPKRQRLLRLPRLVLVA